MKERAPGVISMAQHSPTMSYKNSRDDSEVPLSNNTTFNSLIGMLNESSLDTRRISTESSRKVTELSDLPNEILTKIFSDENIKRKDLVSGICTQSRHFAQISIPILLKDINITVFRKGSYRRLNALMSLLKAHPERCHMGKSAVLIWNKETAGDNLPRLKELLTLLTGVKHLRLRQSPSRKKFPRWFGLKSILSEQENAFSHLEKLEVEDPHFNFLDLQRFSFLKSLKYLQVDHDCIRGIGSLLRKQRKGSNITSLVLTGRPASTSPQMRVVLQWPAGLKVLKTNIFCTANRSESVFPLEHIVPKEIEAVLSTLKESLQELVLWDADAAGRLHDFGPDPPKTPSQLDLSSFTKLKKLEVPGFLLLQSRSGEFPRMVAKFSVEKLPPNVEQLIMTHWVDGNLIRKDMTDSLGLE